MEHVISIINKVLKLLCQLVLVCLIILAGYMNLRLYYQPSFAEVEQVQINEDVYHQLKFLEGRLHDGEAQRMQRLFPEGYLFLNALYGLSWCDFLTSVPDSTELFEEGQAEINWAFQEIDAPEGKRIFDQDLPLEYGAFYQGWSTLLLGKKLSLEAPASRDSDQVERFRSKCALIADAVQNSNIPYLESYRRQTWPADMLPGMLSLKLHDTLFEEKYDSTIQNWIEKVKQHLDPATGLIPHSVVSNTGKTFEGARGSSQSLILNFLIDIDEAFAKEQYAIYKTHFLDRRFGLPGIREYPKGTEGRGDVDSGPVLLGIGGAASIVGQRTTAKFADWTLYEGLRNAIEAFGIPYTSQAEKKYILGQLPMADAFIAWSNAIEYAETVKGPTSRWRWRFQLWSLLVVVVAGYLIVKV